MSMNFSSAFLNGLRQRACDLCASARYYTGGNWYDVPIETKSVQANGAVHITFLIQKQGADTATSFRLLGEGGATLATQNETVTFAEGVTEMLYRFKIGITPQTEG